MVTVEMIKNDEMSTTMLTSCHKRIVFLMRDYRAILVRQNSIMREDTCYLTFAHNSLFSVANNLGYMTFENSNVRQNENMRAYISSALESGSDFLKERFVDRIMFCCIGNSRDEGYFACLRKLFMVVFSFRKKQHSANFNIESFCAKANECLLDNPLSMYFHRYLLRVLQIYSNRE